MVAHRPRKKVQPRRTNPTLQKKEGEQHRKERAAKILRALRKQYPGARTELLHENPFQLLIATILSAQCTDQRVNMVTPDLFRHYPTPGHFARVQPAVLEEEIRSTGFYRMKAKSIIACASAIVDQFNGMIPSTMEELVRLPGVGRKTANVVLGQAFGIASGVVVDTHVQRLAGRLGLSVAEDPKIIEQDMMRIYPQQDWIEIGSLLILHGRRTCIARKPDCASCVVGEYCPSRSQFLKSRV
jgi:endonuclease-3